MEEEADEYLGESAEIYLQKLHTYLLALAKIGSVAVVPQPSETESQETDSTDYVAIPLDLVMKYFHRAQMATKKRKKQPLQWLQGLDEAERKIWVEEYRMTSERQNLGKVIQRTMALRDAHWTNGPEEQERNLKYDDKRGEAQKGDGGRGDARREWGPWDGATTSKAGPPLPPRRIIPPQVKIAYELRDGTKLCRDYMVGKCNKQNCSRGQHRCGVVLNSGRVCGSNRHIPKNCDAAKRTGS